MRRFIIAVVASAALVGLVGSSAQAGEPASGARRFIEQFGSRVVALVKSSDIGAEEQQKQLQVLLLDNVDFERIGRYILGDQWDKSTPEQRSQYQSLFAKYALSLFSRTLLNEGVDGFAVVGLDTLRGSQALVHTRIQKPRGEALQWSWQIRETNGRYRAVDLVMNGVSLVKTYRAEIASVVANLGMDGLLKILWIKSS